MGRKDEKRARWKRNRKKKEGKVTRRMNVSRGEEKETKEETNTRSSDTEPSRGERRWEQMGLRE